MKRSKEIVHIKVLVILFISVTVLILSCVQHDNKSSQTVSSTSADTSTAEVMGEVAKSKTGLQKSIADTSNEVMNEKDILFNGRLRRYFSLNKFNATLGKPDSVKLLSDQEPCTNIFQEPDGTVDPQTKYLFKNGTRFENLRDKVAIDEIRFIHGDFIVFHNRRLNKHTTLDDLKGLFPNAAKKIRAMHVAGEGKLQVIQLREDNNNTSDGHINIFIKKGIIAKWYFIGLKLPYLSYMVSLNKYIKLIKNTAYGYILILLMISTAKAQGQHDFNKTIFQIQGDLNKDGKTDLVIVKADTVNKHHPYLLEIFFATHSGGYHCIFRSQNAIMPKFPKGDQQSELLLEQLTITNGVLIFTNQRIRGNMTHKFRFQHGNFELIGYTERNAGPAHTDCKDINLSTGRQIVWQELYEKEEKTSGKISFKKYKVLPKLQDFNPLTTSYVNANGSRVEL